MSMSSQLLKESATQGYIFNHSLVRKLLIKLQPIPNIFMIIFSSQREDITFVMMYTQGETKYKRMKRDTAKKIERQG